MLLAADVEDERMVLVVARERADAVRAQELVLVEQVAEDALELLLARAATAAGVRRSR